MCGGFALFFLMGRRNRPFCDDRWRATPTSPALCRPAGVHVGVALPAEPLSSVGPRKQALTFPDLPAPMLASPSRQSLNPPSSHANKARPFPHCRRPCWRRPARRDLILRRATPTSPALCRPAGVHVGVALPAEPLSSVGPRKQALTFPDLPAPMLASPSRQSLNPPSSHANKVRPFPRCRRPCWSRPPGKAFVFRRATPTSPALSRAVGAHVGVTLPAKP